jgi:hypothetical protein
MNSMKVLFFSIVFFQAAFASASQCFGFYSSHSSGQASTVSKLQFLLSASEADIKIANEQLKDPDQHKLNREIEKDQMLAKTIQESSPEKTIVHIKNLIKSEIIFSKGHMAAVDKALNDVLNFKSSHYYGFWGKSKKAILLGVEQMLTSENPGEKESIEKIISRVEESIRNRHHDKNWTNKNSFDREKTAIREADRKKKTYNAEFLEEYTKIQDFFESEDSSGILKTVIRRSLPLQLKAMMTGEIPTWKTLTGNLSALAVQASGSAIAVGEIYSIFPAAGVATAIGGIVLGGKLFINSLENKSHIKNFLVKRKLKKDSIIQEQAIAKEMLTAHSLTIVENQLKTNEQLETKEDVTFSLIMGELQSGLSIDDPGKILFWGKEFQRGFANVAQRARHLEERAALILQTLEPVVTELNSSQPSALTLMKLQDQVGTAGASIQGLHVDVSFLKIDYLTLGIALDQFINAVTEIQRSTQLDPAQQQATASKLTRLKRAQEMLLMSAAKLNTLTNTSNGVLDTINTYHESILSELTSSLEKRK